MSTCRLLAKGTGLGVNSPYDWLRVGGCSDWVSMPQSLTLSISTMTCQASLAQLIHVLAATPIQLPVADTLATGVTTDTRSLQPGQVFLALRGETFDGHSFLDQAADRGAIAAIVDTQYAAEAPPLPLLQVPDTLAAYQAIAQWWSGDAA